jgi:hypothetical protein
MICFSCQGDILRSLSDQGKPLTALVSDDDVPRLSIAIRECGVRRLNLLESLYSRFFACSHLSADLVRRDAVTNCSRMGVKGEVLTMRLEPGTPQGSSAEEGLATRLFTPEEGKSMEPHSGTHLVHVHRGVIGTALRNHDNL